MWLARAGRIHQVQITAALTGGPRIVPPPLVQLTRHAHRIERRTKTVTLTRPGTGQTVSETVSVALPNGGSTTHTISA